MRALAFLIALSLWGMVAAQQRPAEIDPNTKTQGGADLPGSGAAAGAGVRPDDKPATAPRANDERRRDVAEPEKDLRTEERPFTERGKPGEREEKPDASLGELRKDRDR
jgi:hypothetical protein